MKLLVLDGNSILNRAFYGIRILSTKDGMFTNGIYGFLTMFLKIREETAPDAIAFTFDRKEPTFRHKAYDGYKAGRKGMPEELASQLPVLKELLTLLGYRVVECAGYEADDILGTLAKACGENGGDCVIATGDRDSLQLVNEHVTVRLAATKFGQPQVTVYDEAAIMQEYGVKPKQLIDMKAIQGDSSDQIPGVSGIGPKGAGELIQKFGSLSGVYENLSSPEIRESVRQKLEKDQEQAKLSYYLGTICTEAPVCTELSEYIPQEGDPAEAKKLMTKLELFSLLPRLIEQKEEPVEETEALTAAPCSGAAILTRVSDAGRADFLCEYENSLPVRMIFKTDGELVSVPCEDAFLRAFCLEKGVLKTTCDCKPFFAAALKKGFRLEGKWFDTMLAGYLLNPSASGYDVLRMAAERELPAKGTGILAEAAVLPQLADRLLEEIKENKQEELLFDVEIPLARVLASMEKEGFAVDAQGINEFGEKLSAEISELQKEIFESVGYEFNINSPKQLGDALFVKLGLQHGKKTKSGYSTNADVLENLRWEHPAVDMVLRFRTLSKLKSTYCDGLLKEIGADGRIHSNFNQTETRTGRISSTEPNLQNIPVRTPLGREMRKFFEAKPGCLLVDADYSQIELRVLAHVSEDKNMIAAFQNGDDIHRATAAQVFHLPENMVTPELRSRAKAVNFGIVYGISAFSLSKDIGVSRKEAETYIREYMENFSGVREYMEKSVAKASECGYAETIFGRRRYLQELASGNFNLRAFGERVARNMPIQGAAADIIKIAMVRVHERLEKENLRAKLILQVHDELIVEAPEEEVSRVNVLLTEEMEHAAELSVPLLSEAHTGKTWYDAKG